ncbi:hypothetical protein GCM10010399_37060 [Dactylosporangium fulvum]
MDGGDLGADLGHPGGDAGDAFHAATIGHPNGNLRVTFADPSGDPDDVPHALHTLAEVQTAFAVPSRCPS